METSLLKLIIVGLFFILIFLSGYWLKGSGKPYHPVIFNAHKLIGLVAGVYLIITIYQVQQMSALSRQEITAIVITVLCFVLTGVTGGLLNIEKPMPSVVTIIHKVFPFITIFFTAVTLYLF